MRVEIFQLFIQTTDTGVGRRQLLKERLLHSQIAVKDPIVLPVYLVSFFKFFAVAQPFAEAIVYRDHQRFDRIQIAFDNVQCRVFHFCCVFHFSFLLWIYSSRLAQ